MSEICSNNLSIFKDCNGNYPDYIKLFNPTDMDINLEGYVLSDSKNFKEEHIYRFSNVNIPAYGYFTVIADGTKQNIECGDIHTNLKLSSEGEEIYLKTPSGRIVDAVAISKMEYNTSYVRIENEWQKVIHERQVGVRTLPSSIEGPTFSLESGSYSQGKYLELTTGIGTSIYYTLDGTEPDTSDYKYTEPILISDVSNNENLYSMIDDVSIAYDMSERYRLPNYKIDKALIVRARTFDDSGNSSATVTKTYFCDIFLKDLYKDISVISIVIDPENLFGYADGIYVKGKTFDLWLEGNKEQYDKGENWWHYPSNFHNRGVEWEREADIAFLGKDKELLLSQKIGIRIKGGGSRGQVQKSLNLFSRREYDENAVFPIELYDEGIYPKNLTLFSGGDDLDTKIKDILIADLCKERDFSTLESIPCFLFLNGEYWGIYHLQEKYDSHYIESKYGVNRDNIVMIKNMEMEEGEAEDIVFYEELMNFPANNDFQNATVYEQFCEMVDIQSFIDYYAAEIYIARNNDWPRANEAFWRTRDKVDAGYSDGRWRWMLFDVNSGGLSYSQSEDNTFEHVITQSVIFRGLFDNTKFCEQFIVSFMDMYNTVFKPSNVIKKINVYEKQLEEPIIDYYKRFYGKELDYDYYKDKVRDLKLFFENRPQYILQHLIETFGIQGELIDVIVEGNILEGEINLNTLNLDLKNSKFVGNYFTDFPIIVKATSKKGYNFIEWHVTEGNGEKQVIKSSEIELYFGNNLNIKPIFEKDRGTF